MMFNLQPKLACTQLNVKKDDIKADDTSEEMLEYVQRLYIHEQVAPIMYWNRITCDIMLKFMRIKSKTWLLSLSFTFFIEINNILTNHAWII